MATDMVSNLEGIFEETSIGNLITKDNSTVMVDIELLHMGD